MYPNGKSRKMGESAQGDARQTEPHPQDERKRARRHFASAAIKLGSGFENQIPRTQSRASDKKAGRGRRNGFRREGGCRRAP